MKFHAYASRKRLAFILIFFLCIVHLGVAQKTVPELWGHRVHDDAKVLRAETIDEVEKKLKLHEDSTSNQIAILIIPSLDGEPIEAYSIRVVEKWKLGTAKNDNGVLLLIAVDDRAMRIEVGQGLEGVLTDAICSRIIRNEMAPRFRNNDYDGGVTAAVDAIINTIAGEYSAGETEDFDDLSFGVKLGIGVALFLVLGLFAGLGLFSEGYMAWVLYVFLMPFYGIFFGMLFSGWLFLIYVIGYPILRSRIMTSAKWKSKLLKWESSSGGGGGRWSSGGSGGGFSGGGGSFGGGGSSGSW